MFLSRTFWKKMPTTEMLLQIVRHARRCVTANLLLDAIWIRLRPSHTTVGTGPYRALGHPSARLLHATRSMPSHSLDQDSHPEPLNTLGTKPTGRHECL